MESSAFRDIKADLTQQEFDRLLEWLDPSRDAAGHKYEQIRSQLVKIFVCRGCNVPEELADETINRVAKKLQAIAGSYDGEPALYFYGVAQKIHLEHLRRKPLLLSPPDTTVPEEEELRYQCLEECMGQLSARNRELILAYYGHEKLAKIEKRQELAARLGIGTNALWIRAHRIREGLRECVRNCLSRK